MSRRSRDPAFLAVAALLLGLAAGASAERGDRDKPVNIEADRMSADDARKIAVFEGRVVLTQGTLVLRADRLTVRQDSEGFQYGIATGNPASFRQKREGADEYVDGEAERIEYDGRVERIEFFNRAHLRRDGGDDVRGNYIAYDSKTEFFTVQSAKGAGPQSRDARVRAVIMPKKKDGAEQKSGAALPLKPAPAVANPQKE